MKAMILAAGLGTRLKRLTDTLPKALVVVNGRTLLEHALKHLIRYGFDDVIINVHHFAEQIVAFLKENNNFGIRITVSDETEELLDTGGGLKKAAWFFDDGNPFILRNADILSDLDLGNLVDFHRKTESLATLAVKNRVTSRYFLFNDDNRLCGWQNEKSGERVLSREETGALKKLAFSGIQVLEPEIFSLITETGCFPVTPLYLRLSRNHRISGYLDEDSSWEDAGKTIPAEYRKGNHRSGGVNF